MGTRTETEDDRWWQAQELIEREQYEQAEREKEQALLRADPAYAAWSDKLDKQQETIHDDNCEG
jgi:hypothetical protein